MFLGGRAADRHVMTPISHALSLPLSPQWIAPFSAALTRLAVPHEAWNVAGGVGMALRRAPPTGVFFARPSPSSHIRGHRFSMEGTAALVNYLEASGRRVVNGSTAIGYENSKVACQDLPAGCRKVL